MIENKDKTITTRMTFITGLPMLILFFSVNIHCQDNYDDPFATPPRQRRIRTPLESDLYRFFPRQCAQECRCTPSFPLAMYCDNRKLKYVPDVPAHVRYLYLQVNEIESVPENAFINATLLQEINLSHNKLKSSKIPKGVFGKLQNLIGLNLDHNKLEEVPVPLPKTLQRLTLGFNQISKLPADNFRTLTNVTILDLSNNKLPDGAVKGNYLGKMKSLLQLNLHSNKLKSMPGDLPTSLLQLSVENNSISSIPENYFRKTPNLISLRMTYNKLKQVPYSVFNLSNLLELNVGHNQLSETFYVSRQLEHLYLNNNHFTTLNITMMCPTTDIANPNHLTYIRLEKNMLRRPFNTYIYVCFPRLRNLDFGEQNPTPIVETQGAPGLFGIPMSPPDGEPESLINY
ncbi:osteomodulin isoform X1 [Stegostoma tigrinum]|uniref:osteomodulin isoform X1 n=2 Tax=Stegostoma tigrinum TaxID=3053191 RepID=UPI00202B1D86|nr:osteomodulin isoform X1 [Stegostoma tigrinum]